MISFLDSRRFLCSDWIFWRRSDEIISRLLDRLFSECELFVASEIELSKHASLHAPIQLVYAKLFAQVSMAVLTHEVFRRNGTDIRSFRFDPYFRQVFAFGLICLLNLVQRKGHADLIHRPDVIIDIQSL